jgi:predicted Zn finger-like uncharacterized protein
VIIECPTCRARYQYDEDRFERKRSKKIKCAKCQQVFEIHNPAFIAAAPAADQDDTAMRRNAPAPIPSPDDTAEKEAAASAAAAASDVLAMPDGRRLSLAIINGPDAGSVFRVEKPRVTIGRSNADLTLNDTEASRNHAAVEIRGLAYTLVDLGSTNGTLVNGEKIAGPTEMQNHSEFVVGASTLMLIVTET